jgi:hypothetical protein
MISSAASAEPARRISRTADPLEIPGDSLPDALGAPLQTIEVSALHDGTWVRIPSQIDERRRVRTDSGEILLDYVLPRGRRPTVDDDAAFDADDLLVFLAGDLGDPIGEAFHETEDLPLYEIEVTDPRDGSRGWVYVSVGNTGSAVRHEDYVSYRPEESILEGRRYRIRLSEENPLLYEELILKGDPAEGAAAERSIIDRFKMRAEASLFIPFLRFRRDESDLLSRTIGWIDGPVRVIRRMETRVDLLWGFTTAAQVQDTVFYPDHFFFRVDLTSPVALNRLISDAEVRLSADMNGRAAGMLFVSPGNPSGFVVDGFMSEQETHMERGDQLWYAVGDGTGTLFSRLVLPDGAPVVTDLVYMDDRGLPDPPEGVSGRWGDAGYRLRGLASIKKGSHRILIHSMIGEGYQAGRERVFLGIMDQPLSWTCRPLPGRTPDPAH